MLKFTLEGKTVLITGASSGIGRGVAIACAAAGARCILVARNVERLGEVQAACGGGSHAVESVDVTDNAAIKSLVGRLPQLDGVVHCAGIGDNHLPLKFLTEEFVDKVLSVNLKAPMLFLAALEKQKKLNRGASVVMISSISSFYAVPAHTLYSATKGGLTAFVKAAAADLSGKRIRVNSIAPGMINTPLTNYANITEEQKNADMAKYPLKRYGEPEDVAGCVVYLLSDVSSWVTGQQFVVDGGITIGN